MAYPEQSEHSEDFLISPEEFTKVLPLICDRETSADPEGWGIENPLWGQCAVVATLAQKIYGGKLLRASLLGTAYEKGRSHYMNRLPWGDYDFTAEQMIYGYPGGLVFEEREAEYVLSYPETFVRFELLCDRLNNYLCEK